MRLKTYRAASMAEVLAAVKKDLGKDAVILHTRTVKSGGWLGLGRRTSIEVTAADEAPAAARRGTGAAVPAFGRAAFADDPAIDEAPPPRPPGGRAAVPAASAAVAYARAARGGAPAEPPTPAPPGAGDSATPVIPSAVRAPVVESDAAPKIEPTVMVVRGRKNSANDDSVASDRGERLAGGRDGLTGRIQKDLSDIKLLVSHVLQASGGAGPQAPGGAMPDALMRHYLRLLESQVSREIADRLVARVRDELRASELRDEEIVRAAMVRHLAAMIPVAEAPEIPTRTARGTGTGEPGRPFVVALVGPTGVGKTTTIAKLAATYRLRQGRSVGLITADTYRIAAVDQLRTYASIIGLPLKVVMTPAEMGAAVDAMSHHDVVLLDTAGRSQRNTERLAELSAFLDAARPSETHLVLSSAAAQEVLLAAAESFAVLRPNRVILTKLDEAVNFGVVVNVMERLKTHLSFVTTGQEVPDHIEPGRPERLARMILEPEASRPTGSGGATVGTGLAGQGVRP